MQSRWIAASTGLMTLSALVLAPSLASADARQFEIKNDGGSRIQFVSDAPLETITGVSSHVQGQATFDPANLSGAQARVEVRVASLRTGVDLRDEHLRGDGWLDAAKHPNAVYELTKIRGPKGLKPNRSTRMKLHGKFTLHGQTRKVVANAQVRFVPLTDAMKAARVTGDVLMVQASFKVKLTDFGVSVPLPVRLKVSNEIQVNVNIRAVAKSGS